MMRFIYVCMAVVAVALLSIAAQPMIDGIGDARQTIAARDAAPEEQVENVAAIDESMTPEELNALETAAGGNDVTADQGFGENFTGTAPAALAEENAPQAIPSAAADDIAQ